MKWSYISVTYLNNVENVWRGGWVRGGGQIMEKKVTFHSCVSWSLGDWGNNGKQGEDVGEGEVGGGFLEKVILFVRSFPPGADSD